MGGDLKLLAELVSRLTDDEADIMMEFIRSFHAGISETERNSELELILPDPA